MIPIKDEAESIGYLLDETEYAIKTDYLYEIILIDDGSIDNTRNMISQYMSCSPLQITCFRHDRNYGQSAALLTGIRGAMADWIITMDGDGQNDPADIKTLLNELKKYKTDDPRMICGRRLKRKDTLVKKYSSKIANAFRSYLLRDEAPDTGCGLKLIHRATFLNLPHFDHMHRFLPALFKNNGYTVCHVDVNHRYRMSGQSKYGIQNRLWAGLIDTAGLIWLNRRCLQPYTEEVLSHDN